MSALFSKDSAAMIPKISRFKNSFWFLPVTWISALKTESLNVREVFFYGRKKLWGIRYLTNEVWIGMLVLCLELFVWYRKEVLSDIFIKQDYTIYHCPDLHQKIKKNGSAYMHFLVYQVIWLSSFSTTKTLPWVGNRLLQTRYFQQCFCKFCLKKLI